MAESPSRTSGEDENNESEGFKTKVCVKLKLEEYIAAYLEKRELERFTQPVNCEAALLEKITNNYVIVKKIISNLSWQDKLICKHVCSTWHSAVLALQKEQMGPTDFVIHLNIAALLQGIKFKTSNTFLSEPMVVLTFANTAGFSLKNNCQLLVPTPCTPECENEHSILDMVNKYVNAPKNCMLTAKGSGISYLPLRSSETFASRITQKMFSRMNPFIFGVHIPKIPNVEFHLINIKSSRDMQTSFYDVVDQIGRTRTFKAVLVYVTENFLWHTVEDIVFLNYFKDVQPTTPYAMAGCIVEDTLSDQEDLKLIVDSNNHGSEFVSENLLSIGVFSVPKNLDESLQGVGSNFEAYSLVIESSEWSKQKIQSAIIDFSKKVPRFEHSVAIKLSCVGRDQKHDLEQEYFASVFPRTRILGCYGNGELGINHPTRPQPDPPPNPPNPPKKLRRNAGPQFSIMYSIMYSYSTVFLYLCWGKMIAPPERSPVN